MNRTFFQAATFIAACSVFLLSCDTLPTGPAVIGGFYTYRAYDTSDSVVVTGTIVLRNSTTTILTGTWDLHTVGNGGQSGPQTGRGTLTGSTDGGVSMNLNPSMADNNVILFGQFDRNEITGAWQWITFAGVSADGRFTMKKW